MQHGVYNSYSQAQHILPGSLYVPGARRFGVLATVQVTHMTKHAAVVTQQHSICLRFDMTDLESMLG